MSLFHLTEHNFKKEVLESDLPVLVDFWAERCAPCKMVAPIIDELAKEFAHKVKIGKLDVEKHSGIANRYGIMSIPTLMLFKKGKVMEHMVGAVNKTELKKRIEGHL